MKHSNRYERRALRSSLRGFTFAAHVAEALDENEMQDYAKPFPGTRRACSAKNPEPKITQGKLP